jgi:hypothetical protein
MDSDYPFGIFKLFFTNCTCTGADPGFQVRGGGEGAHLKILRRAEGGAKTFGVFRVKKILFFPILGGGRRMRPLDPPLLVPLLSLQ